MDTIHVIAQHLYQEDLYQIPGKVLVVIPHAWQSVSEADRNVLIRMINAVKLHFGSIQLVERSALSVDDVKILAPEKILLFGVPITPMPTLYEVSSVAGIPLIAADPLEKLDDAKKKILWGALKQMFGI